MMKKLLVTALLSGLGLVAGSAAQAQSAPDFPTTSPGSSEAGARRNTRATADELARSQRQATMSPDEARRDQQLQILEARTGMSTGNTSLGRSGPERQFESKKGGFMVRKFKDRSGTNKQKRGVSHAIGGANPKGKPLVHKRTTRKKFFF